MSKKSMIMRNEKRKRMVKKYEALRKSIKQEIQENKDNMEVVFALQKKLSTLPRNSSSTRVRNICYITGRSRGNYRRFGISRIQLRKMASFAEIPGVRKSSW